MYIIKSRNNWFLLDRFADKFSFSIKSKWEQCETTSSMYIIKGLSSYFNYHLLYCIEKSNLFKQEDSR